MENGYGRRYVIARAGCEVAMNRVEVKGQLPVDSVSNDKDEVAESFGIVKNRLDNG